MSCLAVIRAGRPGQLAALQLVAERGNINVLGNKTHLSNAAAVPTAAAAVLQGQVEKWIHFGR